jgi:hypothetical protein
MSDVAVDSENVVHVVYEEWVPPEPPMIVEAAGGEREIVGLSEVFYRRSTDNGRSWSAPVNLSRTTNVGSHRVQIKIDTNDVIYATWDEGWDRWSDYDQPREGVYTRSTDGGQTWSEPKLFSAPERTNAQMAAASDNGSGVLAVWRPTTIDQVFFAWSTDSGLTWTRALAIPGFYARPYNDTLFDAYDMATDSAGNIHLVAVGRLMPASPGDVLPLGVYHLVWDGAVWATPEPIAVYEPGAGLPEYPKLAISEGNQLHVVWFVREGLAGMVPMRVFYSHSQSQSPRQTPAPTLAPTVTPLPAPESTPMVSVTPTLSKIPNIDESPQDLFTESDEIQRLVIVLSPIVLLVALIAWARVRWNR